MDRQQKSHIVFRLAEVVQNQDHGSDGIIPNSTCDGYLYLLIGLEYLYLLNLVLDFVLAWVNGFDFKFLNVKLAAIRHMDKNFNDVWMHELCYDTYF